MAIFDPNSKKGVAKSQQISKGGGSSTIFSSNSQSVNSLDREATFIVEAGSVTNATKVLQLVAGNGTEVTGSANGTTTTVTITTLGDAIVNTWNSTTTYELGELVSDPDDRANLYISLIDENLNNALTDATSWKQINEDFVLQIDDTLVKNGEIYGVDTDIIADTDWVKNEGVHKSRFFKVDNGNDPASATGLLATAIGPSTTATNSGALSIGNASDATGVRSVAIGDRAIASDSDAVAIGDNALSDTEEATSIGSNTISSGERSVALGAYVTASGLESVAIGTAKGENHEDKTIASGPNAIAMGSGSLASGVDSIALGEDAEATATDTIAIGDGANATAENAIALGDADASGTDSIAIGKGTRAAGANSIALGNGASTSTDNKMEIAGINDIQINDFHGDTDQYIVVGNDGVWELRNLVPGHDINVNWLASENTSTATATADNSLALGGGSAAQDSEATAVGTLANASGVRSIALGYGANVINTTHDRSIVIGHGNSTSDSELSIFGVNTIRTPSFTGSSNQFIQVDSNGSWTVATPVDNNTTYTAGYGLTLNDTEFKADTDTLAARSWTTANFAPLSRFYTDDSDDANIDGEKVRIYVNDDPRLALTIDSSQDLIAYHDTGGQHDSEVVIWDASAGYIPKTALEPNAFSETIDFVDARSDTEWAGSTLVCDTSTGFEFVRDANGDIRLQEYVPTPNFAISLANGEANRSWFNSNTTGSVTVSASHGTLGTITSATVNGSTDSVTIDNDNNTVGYPVSNANGLYTLNVHASGTNADDVSQTANTSHSWRVYADYWLATNQASADAAFSQTAGRSTERFQTGDITARGYTFLTVSNTEFANDFQFRTALGNLTVGTPTVFDITIGSVTKEYKRYYLGNFNNDTTITVSGG